MGQRISISNKFPGDAALLLVQGLHFQNHCPRTPRKTGAPRKNEGEKTPDGLYLIVQTKLLSNYHGANQKLSELLYLYFMASMIFDLEFYLGR